MVVKVCKNCYCMHDETVCPECRSTEFEIVDTYDDVFLTVRHKYGLDATLKAVGDGKLKGVYLAIVIQPTLKLAMWNDFCIGAQVRWLRFRLKLAGGVLGCLKRLNK